MTRCESYPPCFGTIYFPTAPSFSLGEDSGWSLFLMKRSFTEQNGIPVRGLSGYTPDSVCRPRSYHEAG